jgi:hypothetical protein
MHLRLAAAAAAAALLASAGPAGADDPTWTAKLVARTDVIAAKVAKVRGLKIKRHDRQGRDRRRPASGRASWLRMDEDATPAERAADAAVGQALGPGADGPPTSTRWSSIS